MNRKQRRRLMKKNPAYRKAVKRSTKEAVDNLEEVFKKQWTKNEWKEIY